MAKAACNGPAAYSPRRARDSPLYRLAETHYETSKQVYDERFEERYGGWRAVIEGTLFAFLDCGIEERGFARVRCDECRREFRVALSCKRRGFCPSCHAKRAVLWAEWLATEVLAEAHGRGPRCGHAGPQRWEPPPDARAPEEPADPRPGTDHPAGPHSPRR